MQTVSRAALIRELTKGRKIILVCRPNGDMVNEEREIVSCNQKRLLTKVPDGRESELPFSPRDIYYMNDKGFAVKNVNFVSQIVYKFA